jgi:hypothetical protein
MIMWNWIRRAILGPPQPAAFSREQGKGCPDCRTAVRDAGPESMRDPPRRWDAVDEQVDESFPASDPPGGY